ncbi:MAG TPA: aconitate hydratase AcnA [Steroidobacter sp.]|uniref:aconitate hydratase AcnA n=1 Tax=Steroidobacter sp. TaxID=1978227 RepID=UPI002ED82305
MSDAVPVSLGSESYRIADLRGFAGAELDRLPWVLRVLLENVLRRGSTQSARAILGWLAQGTSNAEIAFHPGRLLMHDTTCVPALVDIAALRSTLAEAGHDPAQLNPVLPVDVSVDHSIAVDYYATPDALQRNMQREIERNAERYRLMKWATRALRGVKVHPPGTGIMHTVNLERLATVVTSEVRDGAEWAVPDTLIGTDSHTPMINGIGVLAWGVGGLEAESVMFGMPVMLRIPEVVGVRLTGALPEGTLATDLALLVTERLRRLRLAGKFVEFHGPGVSTLSGGERAVIANMAPEYGASTGFFPIDQRTIDYLLATGRSREHTQFVESYARQQALWFDPESAPRYTETLEIDLSTVQVSLAGPRRPQDRLSPHDAPATLAQLLRDREHSPASAQSPADGAVAIAAITSCTNTSDARLTIAAGLLAKKARALGLKPAAWVKTSFAPGSPTAERYLRRAGLLEDMEALGFGIVGFGCTTCIGNSGPLSEPMQEAVTRGVLPVAVLSGNRNFPGRVHPQIDANFLASPPLVIAYALAGDINRDILEDSIGNASNGRPVYLRDLWPTGAEIDAAYAAALDPADVSKSYERAEQNEIWRALDAPATPLFPWDEKSTYIRRPPFAAQAKSSALGQYRARPLLVLGDDITTDHISPAGQVPAKSDAAAYLIARGENPKDLNVFASRRGNWEAMLRGLYTNRTVRNLLDPSLPPGTTRHAGSNEVLSLWQAAARYQAENVPVVVVAGERYGTGSSRDWAAKGLWLLGVRAVLALSFERIHRSNLIGMGILPLLLPPQHSPAELSLSIEDALEIKAPPAQLVPGGGVSVSIRRGDGTQTTFITRAAVETALEIELLRSGGILPYILERTLRTRLRC